MHHLLKFLEQNKDNRGIMAHLRRGLTKTHQQKAWPYLARFCDISAVDKPFGNEKHDYEVTRTIAGLYASHPSACSRSNMGDLCRRLRSKDEIKSALVLSPESKAGQEGPMGKRLLQLLSAERTEICERVVRVVLYAKSQGQPVDYERLAQDLRYWPKARGDWAQQFWGKREQAFAGESSDDTPVDAIPVDEEVPS